MTKRIALLTFFAVLTISCGSGGSSGPTTPVGPEEFSLDYCRVVEVDNRMRVEWSANRITTGEFRYGQTVFTQLVNVTTPADTHSVALSTYSFSSLYVYRLTAIDAEGNRLEYTGDFETPDKATPEPIISQLRIQEITEASARVTWQTDEPASTILYYGEGVASDSITNSELAMDHVVLLGGLSSSTSYTVRPEAVDADGLRGVGTDSLFATAALLTLSLPATQLTLGDTVLVPVTIDAASDLAALQYSIVFSEGNIEILGISEGPFFDDNEGFNFFRAIANGDNRLTNTMTWVIEYNGNERIGTNADGSGVVAYLELRGLEPGPAGAEFAADSTFGLDMFAQMRTCSLRAGLITVIP
ncbi:MAG: hypothetical protein IPG71_03755 [bacterium]|nr:hypothetical protein [bacterium]